MLLDYGRQVSGAIFQNLALDKVAIWRDYETNWGRFVRYDLISADESLAWVEVQIAPTFGLVSVQNPGALE